MMSYNRKQRQQTAQFKTKLGVLGLIMKSKIEAEPNHFFTSSRLTGISHHCAQHSLEISANVLKFIPNSNRFALLQNSSVKISLQVGLGFKIARIIYC
jgi:hypothetical protein